MLSKGERGFLVIAVLLCIFTIYKDKAGQWRWNLKAGNHEVIAQGEGYNSKQSCLHAVELVKSTTADTEVKVKETA